MEKKSKAMHFLSGKGFYIALAVLMVGAGATAWVAVDRTVEGLEGQQPDSGITESYADPFESVAESAPNVPLDERQEFSVSSESEGSSDSASKPEPAPSDTTESSVELNVSYVFPLDGDIITPYSAGELVKSVTLGDWRTHDGIDIAAAPATPVMAAAQGIVAQVSDDPMFGTTIVIDHPDGCCTIYQSLNESVNVAVGQSVSEGDVIGSVGQTALAEVALESHLHFAIQRDGDYLDPLKVLGR